jgi:hypothetical protein
MMKLRYAALNDIIQTVLQVIAALVNHPDIWERYNNILSVTGIAEDMYSVG